MQYNVSVVEKLKPAIEEMTEVVKAYESCVTATSEVATKTGSQKFIDSVKAMQDAFPALKKTFEEAIEGVQTLVKYYERLDAGLN